MNKKDFKKIESDYRKVKKEFAHEDTRTLVTRIAEEIKEYPIFKDVFNFLTDSFQGKLRYDNITPLVFHSIYITKLLYLCGEKNLDALLTASLHDVLEDTNVNQEEIKRRFLKNREYIIDYLKLLKEDKSLSREPNGKNLPLRYKEHIRKLIGAPKEVINVEITDRFCDLMDLEYITKLPDKERELRLKGKSIKVRSFIENITMDRKDMNKNCLSLFNYKLKQFEDKWRIEGKTEIIS